MTARHLSLTVIHAVFAERCAQSPTQGHLYAYAGPACTAPKDCPAEKDAGSANDLAGMTARARPNRRAEEPEQCGASETATTLLAHTRNLSRKLCGIHADQL